MSLSNLGGFSCRKRPHTKDYSKFSCISLTQNGWSGPDPTPEAYTREFLGIGGLSQNTQYNFIFSYVITPQDTERPSRGYKGKKSWTAPLFFCCKNTLRTVIWHDVATISKNSLSVSNWHSLQNIASPTHFIWRSTITAQALRRVVVIIFGQINALKSLKVRNFALQCTLGRRDSKSINWALANCTVLSVSHAHF